MLVTRGTLGEEIQQMISLEGLFTLTLRPLLWFTKANSHFRSAISNVTGPLLPLGKGTKVDPPFRSPMGCPEDTLLVSYFQKNINKGIVQ